MPIDLPWYLKHTQVRRYTGDFENVEETKTNDSKVSENRAVHISEFQSKTIENENKIKGLKRKLSAIDYGYGSSDIKFRPFSGSLEELIQLETQSFQTRTYSNSNQSREFQKFAVHRNINRFFIVMILFVSFVFVGWITSQKRNREYVAPTTKNRQLNKKKKRKKKKMRTSLVTHDSCTNESIGRNDASGCILQLNDSNERHMNDVFSEDVPRMAEIISRSGLCHQDSIRIAAQEVFAIQRVKHEEAKRIDKERRDRFKAEAETALLNIKHEVLSTVYGNRFLISITIVSFVRIFSCNSKSLLQLIIGENQSDLMGLFINWLLTELCGSCCDKSTCSSFSTHSISPSRSYASYIIIYLTGIETVPSRGIPPCSYTTCLATFVSYLAFTALGHKILQIFHSTTLHRFFNVALVSGLVLGSNIGRSSLYMMFQVFMLNSTIAGSLYLGIDRQLKEFRKVDSDDGAYLEDYHVVCTTLFKQIHKRIIVFSFSGAVSLGVLPLIVQYFVEKIK